ncbi:hypothetical protein AVEN_221479-1 [Araneus ventricosus]|uniref:Uncharacterized protein n=1 Tax=Araneus ventricosus TaxID=182803 RepID=A0A4Y2V8T0_ARAVE|nr:hypothetical protein AVEN_221479-1 [Araneus ventricosus]
MTVTAGRNPNSHHQPRPDPSRRRYVLSLVGDNSTPTIAILQGKREPVYLSGDFSSVNSRYPPVGDASIFIKGNVYICVECGKYSIQDWLECDVDYPGCQVLADDEIIASAIDGQDSCDDEEEPSDSDRAEKGLSSEEAFHCLRQL